MPEDLPEAIKILLWLLIGIIVFGYLIMDHTIIIGLVFALVYFGLPILWRLKNNRQSIGKPK